MNGWILFGLFFLVGICMLVAGLYYLRKERGDKDSVKIYGIISIIGAVLVISSAVVRFISL